MQHLAIRGLMCYGAARYICARSARGHFQSWTSS